MTDTILTVVLVLACIAMIALSAILLCDLITYIMEERRSAKRREELIKNWSKLDLTQALYVDTDSIKVKEEVNHYYGLYQVWYKMRISCSHFYNNQHVGRCTHPDINPDIRGICCCDYKTCPILHKEINNGN